MFCSSSAIDLTVDSKEHSQKGQEVHTVIKGIKPKARFVCCCASGGCSRKTIFIFFFFFVNLYMNGFMAPHYDNSYNMRRQAAT